MKRIRTFPLLLLATLVGLVPSMLTAESRVVTTALGGEGQLLSLLSGTYGELFPGGTEAYADASVLALRQSFSDGRQFLEVVPASLGQDTEEDAQLIVESTSGVSYVFWHSWTNLIHSRLLVSAFDGEDWNEPIEVSGTAFAWHTSPVFAVTRDSFRDIGADDEPLLTRTILHVVWSEEGEVGFWEARYAPLVLENGEYIGEHSVFVLNDLLDDSESGGAANVRVAPVIRSRGTGSSVVSAFFDQRSGRIGTVEFRFVAGELSILADTVADEVEKAVPSALAAKDAADALSSVVRDRLLTYKEQVKPEILQSLSSELELFLRRRVSEGPPDVGRMRDDARAQLIEVGARLTDGEVRRVTAGARAQLIEVGVRGERPKAGRRHDARSVVVSTSNMPEISSAPEIVLSSKGNGLALAWSDGGRLSYTALKRDGTWGGTQQIQLSSQIDHAKAMAILQERVDQE